MQRGIRAFLLQARMWMQGERNVYLSLAPTYSEFLRSEQKVHSTASQKKSPSGIYPHTDVPQLYVITCAELNGPEPDQYWIRQTLSHLKKQNYPRWHWWIVVAPEKLHVFESLSQYDPLLTIVTGSDYLTSIADNGYVALLDPHDVLASEALAIIATAAVEYPTTDFFFCVSDEIDARNRRCNPLLKPDWSPDLLFSCNILRHLCIIRGALWKQIQPFKGYDELAFSAVLENRTIHHISRILYHQRQSTHNVDEGAIRRYLLKQGITNPAQYVENGVRLVKWDVSPERLISIIIPSYDHLEVLRPCLESIFSLTTYGNYQVILVDTGSVDDSTWEFYRTQSTNPKFKLVRYQGFFNFSRACNLGAASSTNDLLLFLNNDTQILQPDWIDRMVQWFQLPGIGAVGAKLLYPDGRIQHAGVVIGLCGHADNVFTGAEEHASTPYGSDDWYRNFLAVTGACLMLPRAVFDAAGCFDESFQLMFSDVDLCIRVHALGRRIIYTPAVRLIHHESVTHQRHVPQDDVDLSRQRWADLLHAQDPYYNTSLSLRHKIPRLKLNDE